MAEEKSKTRVVILGGGFGGVYTAINLEKYMTRAERNEIEVVLVTEDNYIVFQPMLPEVISGAISVLNAVSPIRRLAKRTKIFTRRVEKIDIENKQIHLSPGYRPKPFVLDYDHLVIGLGTITDYSRIPGMKEHAFMFKYLRDALILRNHIVQCLEEADVETDEEEKARLLTFVVGGGGFSGVECMAEINDFIKGVISSYNNITRKDVRLVLLQSADRILPEMDEKLASYAHSLLTKRGIEIQLLSRLQSLSASEAIIYSKTTKEATPLQSRTVVSTVPSGPHPLISTLPFKLVRGRIEVEDYLFVPKFPEVWALGDCAAVPQPDGITSPPTAQHAIRQGKTCARNILATIRKEPRSIFDFTGLGKLGSLGHLSAVAEVGGIRLTGIIAWLMWKAVYLSKFPGLDRKFRVLVDWILHVFLPVDSTQIRISFPDEVDQEHYEPKETIIFKDDYGDKVYFIKSGEVEVVVEDEVVASMTDGEVFGEAALLTDQPRNATIVAKTQVDTVSVSKDAFHQILKYVPGVRDAMEGLLKQRLEDIPSAPSTDSPSEENDEEDGETE